SALDAALSGMTFAPPSGLNGNATLSLDARSDGAAPVHSQLLIGTGHYLVTTTADSGPGSLRQAILNSNLAVGATNTIEVNISRSGVQTIVPQSPLPAITNSVLIDGFSQPGYAGEPLIELNASREIQLNGIEASGNGLTITAPDVTVRGLDINSFGQG